MRLLLGVAALLAAGTAAAQAGAGAGGDLDVAAQDLKRRALELNRDLLVQQEATLYPAATQLAVFVAADLGSFFELESLKLSIDGQQLAEHRYSAAEANALFKGGTQQLYVGNLADGRHELLAVFSGRGAHRPIRRAVPLAFDKQPGARQIELRVGDGESRQEPAFSARLWP